MIKLLTSDFTIQQSTTRMAHSITPRHFWSQCTKWQKKGKSKKENKKDWIREKRRNITIMARMPSFRPVKALPRWLRSIFPKGIQPSTKRSNWEQTVIELGETMTVVGPSPVPLHLSSWAWGPRGGLTATSGPPGYLVAVGRSRAAEWCEELPWINERNGGPQCPFTHSQRGNCPNSTDC